MSKLHAIGRVLRVLGVLATQAFFLGTVIAAFFGVPACWASLKAQGLIWGIGATLLFGRFFCRAVCPLGIAQSVVNWIFHPRTHVRRVCTRLPETKAQRIVRWSVVAAFAALAACGCMGAATMVVPISIFGKAVTLWTPGLAAFGLVMALAAVGKGRVWCNWVCPFGTIYNLTARICLCKDKVGKGCAHCGKCLGGGRTEKPGTQEGGVSRRETLKGVAVRAVADKMTDGGYADVTLPGVPDREGGEVLPPGALERRAFALKCAGCQLCVANCPGKCLKPSMKFGTFGQPTMDFRHGYCIAACVKCGEICPEMAIRKMQTIQRPNVHMGEAIWKKDRCVRTTVGDPCTACVRKCPVQAIAIVKGFPVVNRDKCIGCGACEHVCPARPLPAIYVKGHDMQRIVVPMSEEDLIAEMKTLVAGGKACVVARGGVIVRQLEGRGIGPILEATDIDSRAFAGAIVYDKIVGRAAAAVYVTGHAAQVCADVMSEEAFALLEKNGIRARAAVRAANIINREKTGICPLEKAIEGMEDPREMVKKLRKAMKR